MLSGTNQMQCGCRSNHSPLTQPSNGFCSVRNQPVGNRKPGPQPQNTILGKLGRDFAKLALRECTFTPLTMKYTGNLDASESAAVHATERLGQTADGFTFRFVDIKLGDIWRIEIAHVRSRSSEISFVLFVPRFSEPSMREYPLRSLRAANKLTVGVFSIGMIRATFLPRSVTVIPPNFSLFRTHSPVFSCNSRIEIDFMCHTVTH